jgi:thioredoxin reductase (NADPH)
MRKVIIIGSGPAGYTAALYGARANLSPLLVAGYAGGGQLMTTTEVENYPGFPDGIKGPDLMVKMREQARRFGTEIIDRDVTQVDLKNKPFKVWIEDKVEETLTLIISTGAKARMLGLESEKKLLGHGLSSCATCDGAFFKSKEIGVVGGGDSAMEEANFLTRFASRVTLIHRRDEFRASQIMIDRAKTNPKIDWRLNTAITEVLGNDQVEGVKIKDLKSGQVSILKLEGLFIAIGHDPNTKLFSGQIDMDANGYIKTDGRTRTNIPGVFACGDVQDHIYRQAVTAAGSGCMAALETQWYLEHHDS